MHGPHSWDRLSLFISSMLVHVFAESMSHFMTGDVLSRHPYASLPTNLGWKSITRRRRRLLPSVMKLLSGNKWVSPPHLRSGVRVRSGIAKPSPHVPGDLTPSRVVKE